MIGLERGRDEPPHLLVAAEPVREEHRARAPDPGLGDVVTVDDAHRGDTTRVRGRLRSVRGAARAGGCPGGAPRAGRWPPARR